MLRCRILQAWKSEMHPFSILGLGRPLSLPAEWHLQAQRSQCLQLLLDIPGIWRGFSSPLLSLFWLLPVIVAMPANTGSSLPELRDSSTINPSKII